MQVEVLVSDLLGQLESSVSPGDRSALLHFLQRWLKSHLKNWSAQLRERWGLDQLATMDLYLFPIEKSALNPDEEVRQLKAVRPTSMELLAMRLRDILWVGITVESTVVCPRCSETQLRVLEDGNCDSIVLSCDLCAWSQTPQGRPWTGTSPLQPAPTSRIHGWVK